MVVFEETREDLTDIVSPIWFVILVTIWALLGVSIDYTGGDDSILFWPFVLVFVIGFFWGIIILIGNIKRLVSNLNKKKCIFDDQSFIVKHFIFKKSYEYSGIKNLSVYMNYICFIYRDTQNTIYFSDYRTAFNVAAELEKHCKAGA